jgi:hypothetical protein
MIEFEINENMVMQNVYVLVDIEVFRRKLDKQVSPGPFNLVR